jgi:hypothetical protein
MSNSNRTQLYKEELEDIFNKNMSGVRCATVIAAFIDAQIFYLAETYLKGKGFLHKPRKNQEYSQSLNILKVNKVLLPEELDKIKKFRDIRNDCIHGIFKGMTRDEWNRQVKLAIKLGRPIIKELDKKLFYSA